MNKCKCRIFLENKSAVITPKCFAFFQLQTHTHKCKTCMLLYDIHRVEIYNNMYASFSHEIAIILLRQYTILYNQLNGQFYLQNVFHLFFSLLFLTYFLCAPRRYSQVHFAFHLLISIQLRKPILIQTNNHNHSS